MVLGMSVATFTIVHVVISLIAIAAGVVIGAGLGDSARAALMTRGYAEMVRLAEALGARAETLAGLSGFGDLVLTCTSDQSRNFRFGCALGKAEAFDPRVTVEGVATARAVVRLAAERGIDLTKDAAREVVYGMPYADWKTRYQK